MTDGHSSLNVLAPASDFTPEELKAWQEFLDDAPRHVLTEENRDTIITAARLLAKTRANVATIREQERLMTCLGKLEMTPADRAAAMRKRARRS